MLKFLIYRYDAQLGARTQTYELARSNINGNMLLDALVTIQAKMDVTLAFRKSCREGVCGSDGMNVNGKNTLACITPLDDLSSQTIILKPLTGVPVIKDLIVDLNRFYCQYEQIEPYLQNDTPLPITERLQTIPERAKLDGLYECILCGCCSTACPIYISKQERFIGPASMLQAARFILDSRDTKTQERIAKLARSQDLFKCNNILSCIDACPIGLDPNQAIDNIHKKHSS